MVSDNVFTQLVDYGDVQPGFRRTNIESNSILDDFAVVLFMVH